MRKRREEQYVKTMELIRENDYIQKVGEDLNKQYSVLSGANEEHL